MHGKLTITWSSGAHGVNLNPNTSTMKYSGVNIGYTSINGTEYEAYSLPAAGTVSVNGAFPGTDGGASSTMTNLSKKSESGLVTECNTRAGLSTLKLAAGTAALG